MRTASQVNMCTTCHHSTRINIKSTYNIWVCNPAIYKSLTISLRTELPVNLLSHWKSQTPTATNKFQYLSLYLPLLSLFHHALLSPSLPIIASFPNCLIVWTWNSPGSLSSLQMILSTSNGCRITLVFSIFFTGLVMRKISVNRKQ